MPYIMHRLEWIPALIVWFILLSCRFKDQNETKNLPYSQFFAEATTVSSAQKLVDEHCMTDAKGLCTPSLNMGNDSRCADPFDPPFVSLLDPYMDSDACRLQLPNAEVVSTENDAMRLIIKHTLQEAYSFSRLYFRVKGFQSSEEVNHNGLRRFVFVSLESLTEFFAQDNHKDFVLQDRGLTIVLGLWNEREIMDLLTMIVNDYESGDDNSLLNSDASKDRFFLDCFLSKVKQFLDKPEQEFVQNSAPQGILKQGIVTNEQLGPCLWHHHDADTLITEGCLLAIDEATVRMQELSYKESHWAFVSNLQKIYPWVSWVFVVLVAFRIQRTKSSKEILRLRQYLVAHVILSISLWIGQRLTRSTCASPFLSMALLSLSVFLGTYLVLSNSKNDDYIEEREGVVQSVVYELPLLDETTNVEEGRQSNAIPPSCSR
jgi:hypothetical protein